MDYSISGWAISSVAYYNNDVNLARLSVKQPNDTNFDKPGQEYIIYLYKYLYKIVQYRSLYISSLYILELMMNRILTVIIINGLYLKTVLT